MHVVGGVTGCVYVLVVRPVSCANHACICMHATQQTTHTIPLLAPTPLGAHAQGNTEHILSAVREMSQSFEKRCDAITTKMNKVLYTVEKVNTANACTCDDVEDSVKSLQVRATTNVLSVHNQACLPVICRSHPFPTVLKSPCL